MSETVELALAPFKHGETVVRPAEFPSTVLAELIRRATLHVLGPEAASKIVANNKKRVKDGLAEFSPEERETELASIRDAYLASLYDGSWGTSAARAARAPAADREKQIFDQIVLAAIKQTLAPHVKSGQMQETTLDGEPAWVQNGNVVPLAEWTRRYFAHPDKGEERMRVHTTQAAEKFAAERRAAELKAEAAKAAAGGTITQDYI